MDFSPAPHCRPYVQRRAGTLAGAAPAGASLPWSIPDLCRAYHWPSGLSGGGVIALVELGGGWLPADMAAYFAGLGLPQPLITDVTVPGGAGNLASAPASDADGEVAMDIQAAAAAYSLATGKPAQIRVYWASAELSGIAAAVRAAAADGCDVCSISWGSDEANWTASGGAALVQDIEAAATQATASGMVVLAAAGDNDSSDGGPTPANVDLPASCPHVIACGGTSKTSVAETVWNDNPGMTDGSGTGGGYSTQFPPQVFQVGAPPGQGRMVPDVAAQADPDIGTMFRMRGAPFTAGGTSMVAPLYAGLFAAVGRKLGFITPKLWANPGCFSPVSQGDNGFYRAANGPNPCAGLGAPNAAALAALLQLGTAADAAQNRGQA